MALEDINIYTLMLQMVAESDRIGHLTKMRHDFVLADQLSRAALSVSNNFAEGYGRSATGERLMLMFYAEGSVQECKNCLRVAVSRNHISEERANKAISMFGRISIGIIEFCASILRDDPDYKGAYRERVNKRRAWRHRKR
jgi:four helix bundle protein